MTRLVVWDIDRVWYKDISTSYVAKGSSQPHDKYLKDFVENKKWFTYEHVKMWEEHSGRTVSSVGDVADMLTQFLYEMHSDVYPDVSYQEVKNRTITGKQSLLSGLTIGDVKRIADSVPYTNGLEETVKLLKKSTAQVGFSDGLGPFVAYKMAQQGIKVGGIVPAILETDYGDDVFNLITMGGLLFTDNAKLTGKTMPFKKSEAISDFVNLFGYDLSECAAIDDSSFNIETLAKIRDGGGVSVGFDVNDAAAFEKAKIPVLLGDDIRPFYEIVRDKRAVEELCETWVK